MIEKGGRKKRDISGCILLMQKIIGKSGPKGVQKDYRANLDELQIILLPGYGNKYDNERASPCERKPSARNELSEFFREKRRLVQGPSRNKCQAAEQQVGRSGLKTWTRGRRAGQGWAKSGLRPAHRCVKIAMRRYEG
jgi:hypothetical protein